MTSNPPARNDVQRRTDPDYLVAASERHGNRRVTAISGEENSTGQATLFPADVPVATEGASDRARELAAQAAGIWNRPDRQERRIDDRRGVLAKTSVNFLREHGTGVYMLADLAIIAIATIIATMISSSIRDWTIAESAQYLILGAVSLPVWLFIFRRQRMYVDRVDIRSIEDARRVGTAAVLGAMGLVLLGWPMQLPVSRLWLMLVLAIGVPILLLERHVMRRFARKRRLSGEDLRPIAIMGTNGEACELREALRDPALGCSVVAFIATDSSSPDQIDGLPVLPGCKPAAEVKSFGATGVVIAATSLHGSVSNGLLRSFLDRRIRIELSSALTDVATSRIAVHPLGRHPMIALEPGFRGGWRATAKRVFDIVVSSILLVLLSPVFLAIAIAIKVDTRGPVFFAQQRAGVRGRPFKVYKFRSMVPDAEAKVEELQQHNESDGPLFKMKDDPRVTRVGKLIRKTSIDELPQLLNVIKGDMSLVGPRPALHSEVREWNDELRNRLRVRPGITGMWQVNGRSDTSFAEYQRLDLFYIDNWSIITDLSILVRTIPAVLKSRGAS